MKVLCEICKSAPAIHVHHIDGDMTNNSPSNLMYLCASCHKKIHAAKSRSRLAKGHFTYRCRHDILAELCEILRRPATSTQLFSELKISGGGFYRYLDLARRLGLIYILDDGKLKVTAKGLKYLEIYKKLPDLHKHSAENH